MGETKEVNNILTAIDKQLKLTKGKLIAGKRERFRHNENAIPLLFKPSDKSSQSFFLTPSRNLPKLVSKVHKNLNMWSIKNAGKRN